MRFSRLIVLFALCLTVASCSFYYGPREEVKAFADDKDALIMAISKKVEADPTLAGVAEAQKLVDAKKDSLYSQRQAIDHAKPGMNANWRLALADSQTSDRKFLEMIALKLGTNCKDSCSEVRGKFSELQDSFNKATKLPDEI
ncbi:MAG: hypothetical protein ABJA02_03550 [Acidobacteriota bacterium]